MTKEKMEYYKKLDSIARAWVNGLKKEIRNLGTKWDPISTNTNQTERAIRNFLGNSGFENAETISKTTMLFVLFKGIEGGYESIGVDPAAPSPDEVESALRDMASNVGVSPKQLQDWMKSVV